MTAAYLYGMGTGALFTAAFYTLITVVSLLRERRAERVVWGEQ